MLRNLQSLTQRLGLRSIGDVSRRATEVRLKSSEQMLYLTFDDSKCFRYPAELLRVESPSVDVVGHDGVKVIVPGKKRVKIMRLEPVGHYAVRIVFDDFHDTGIYSWPYLYDLGAHKLSRSRLYLKELSRQGLSRNPLKQRPLKATSEPGHVHTAACKH